MATKPASMFAGYMTVTQAAEHLGLTSGRVRQLIDDGAIRAEKLPIGENPNKQPWLIPQKEVEKYAHAERKSGRKKGA